MVIDRLTDYEVPLFGNPQKISWYSTVSRQWVARTQKHHFGSVHFEDRLDLEKWRRVIEPNPAGVSRHVRELLLRNVDSLVGFERHIRAFTRIETVAIEGRDFLLLPSVVGSTAPLGSSLVRLEINGGSTALSIITSLLAVLPRLRHSHAHLLKVLGDRDVTLPPPRIPFFEDAECLDILIGHDVHGPLDWIPTSSRIRDLRIDAPSIQDKSGRMQQWIASSTKSLKFLSITANPRGTSLNLLARHRFQQLPHYVTPS